MSDERIRKLERECIENPNDDNIVAFMQEKARTGTSIYRNFLAFLGGHWTLNPPTREGSYLTATREGHCMGYNLAIYVFHRDDEWQAVRGNYTTPLADTWQGYWWSEPLPEMPLAPNISQLVPSIHPKPC